MSLYCLSRYLVNNFFSSSSFREKERVIRLFSGTATTHESFEMNAFQNLLVRKQKVMAWITRLALIQNKNALLRLFIKLIHKPFVHLAYVFPETMFQFVQLRFQTLGINFKIKQIAGTFGLSVVFSMREFRAESAFPYNHSHIHQADSRGNRQPCLARHS